MKYLTQNLANTEYPNKIYYKMTFFFFFWRNYYKMTRYQMQLLSR